MASVTMQQHQHQHQQQHHASDASAHNQLNVSTPVPGGHHLPAGVLGASYHHHHHPDQFISSYQDRFPSRALSTSLSGANHMAHQTPADEYHQHQHQHQLQAVHQHHSEQLHNNNQAGADSAHFFYHQANHFAQDPHHHHHHHALQQHNQSHYHYSNSSSHIDATGYAGYQNHVHYGGDLNNGANFDGYAAANSNYPSFIQSFNRLHDSHQQHNAQQQPQQPQQSAVYSALPISRMSAEETADKQDYQLAGDQGNEQGRADDGSAHFRSKTKLQIPRLREDSIHRGHSKENEVETTTNETVLTELGPKISPLNSTDERLANKNGAGKEVLGLTKRKKGSIKTTGGFSAIKNENISQSDDNDHQLTPNQQLTGSITYNQQTANIKSPACNEHAARWPESEQARKEHERVNTSIDRSSATSGERMNEALGRQGNCIAAVTTTTTSTKTENNAENCGNFKLTQQQQSGCPLAANTNEAADNETSPALTDSNHPLACYSSTISTYHTNSDDEPAATKLSLEKQNSENEYNQFRILEMRKEKSRDAARSRRSKENHEFYELAKLLPLPAAITSQLDFLDKASIIRLTISFLKLRQFSVNGHPPWAPDFTTLGSINPYSTQSLSNYAEHYSSNGQEDSQSRPTSVGVTIKPALNNANASSSSSSSINPLSYSTGIAEHSGQTGSSNADCQLNSSTSSVPPLSNAFPTIDPYQHQPSSCLQDRNSLINEKSLSRNTASLFDIHQGTHILQSLDGFAFAIGRDGRFLYISETVSMYLGLSQVEMTGSSVFDYAHQQDHAELAKQLGIPYKAKDCTQESYTANTCETPPPASVNSQYSAASNETLIDDYVNTNCRRKRPKTQILPAARGAYGRGGKRAGMTKQQLIKVESNVNDVTSNECRREDGDVTQQSSLKDACNINICNTETQGTEEDPLVRQFCIRMKSTLTKRGCQHFKSSGYRVVHVVAHLRSYESNDHGHLMDPLDETGNLSGGSSKQSKRKNLKSTSKESTSIKESIKSHSNDNTLSDSNPSNRVTKQKIIGMVAVAIALPPPSINELRLESGTFVLRLSLDLRVTHIEPKITELLHYPVELIAGRSLYSFIHPADVHQVQQCHKDLLKKGQMMSGYYRLLARNGGYIWVQTCATLICNNTFNGQVPALSNSPMPNSSSIHLAHHGDIHSHHLKMPNYLGSTLAGSSELGQQSTSSAPHSKMMSPGLSNNHLSSNYDNSDQDQCVIFVNYMITNIVDKDEILDVCQSLNYAPLSSFSGNNNNISNNNNVVFNSPTSSCSSPCLLSLKTNTSCGSYASPSTPSSSINLSSPKRGHESKAREARVANGRRTASKAKQQVYLSADTGNGNENGHGHMTTQGTHFGITEQVKLSTNSIGNNHQQASMLSSDPSAPASLYDYSQTPGSVNLALNKAQAESASWLAAANHQPTTTNLLNNASVVYDASGTASGSQSVADHYSSMNRSIYKAAFGLEVSGANYANHQHQAAVYPQAVASYPSSAAVNNTWDTAAAAAVAAASNLSQHHHSATTSTTNPYAHLESHHHQSAAAHSLSTAAAAAAATNHHHSSASSYYNYYGYYGNKFI